MSTLYALGHALDEFYPYTLQCTFCSAKFWAILEFTGYGETINGLSNAYFGIWGSFFNSVFAFGTWLRENKELELFSREEAQQQHTGDENSNEERRSTSSHEPEDDDDMEWND